VGDIQDQWALLHKTKRMGHPFKANNMWRAKNNVLLVLVSLKKPRG